MFHVLFRTFAATKVIIYDRNSAIKHVNNCYRHVIFMRKTDFSQEWKFQFTAYSRQSGYAGEGHPLCDGPRP